MNDVTLLPPAGAYCCYPNAIDAGGAAMLLERATGTPWTPAQAETLDEWLELVARHVGAFGVVAALEMQPGLDQIGDRAMPILTFNEQAEALGAAQAAAERMLDTLKGAGLIAYSRREGWHWFALCWPRAWGAGNALRYRQRAERLFEEGRAMAAG